MWRILSRSSQRSSTPNNLSSVLSSCVLSLFDYTLSHFFLYPCPFAPSFLFILFFDELRHMYEYRRISAVFNECGVRPHPSSLFRVFVTPPVDSLLIVSAFFCVPVMCSCVFRLSFYMRFHFSFSILLSACRLFIFLVLACLTMDMNISDTRIGTRKNCRSGIPITLFVFCIYCCCYLPSPSTESAFFIKSENCLLSFHLTSQSALI